MLTSSEISILLGSYHWHSCPSALKFAVLRSNFTQPVKTQHLAKLANMSALTFHSHFKAVTAMSPLLFQKVLRLQEARRLMLSAMMDAGLASKQVGYVSASQFSREYGRFLGGAPTQDIEKLREQIVGAPDPIN